MPRKKPEPPRCWRCDEVHLHEDRVYLCQSCRKAVCWGELYVADFGLQHQAERKMCGPVQLVRA